MSAVPNSGSLPLSVVIPARNAADIIGHQLDALARQGDDVEFEVIVADNGSTDGTRAVVERIAASFPVALVVADASRRAGICHARNVGVLRSRGDVIAFCDADDVVGAGWVAGAASALGEFDAVAGRTRELLYPFDPDAPVLNPDFFAGRGLHGCNFAVRRETYFAVGGFDESLPPYGCDDSEFSLRLLEAGARLGPAPDMTLYFKRTTALRPLLRKAYLSGVAEAVVRARHPGAFGGRSGSAAAAKELFDLIREAVQALGRGEPLTRSVVRQLLSRVGTVVGALRLRHLRGRDAAIYIAHDPRGH